MSDQHELARAFRSLARDAKKATPMIRVAIPSLAWVAGPGAGVIAAIGVYATEFQLSALPAAVAVGALTTGLFFLLVATRVIKLRDKESRAQAQRLVELQENYWTLERALVIDTDVVRDTSPRVRVWLQNRGPDEIRVHECSALLVLEAPFTKEARTRNAVPLHTTVLPPTARVCCFEFSLVDVAPTRRFQFENLQVVAEFPLRPSARHVKTISLEQPMELSNAKPDEPAP